MDWNAKEINARSHIWELTPLILITNKGLERQAEKIVYAVNRELYATAALQM